MCVYAYHIMKSLYVNYYCLFVRGRIKEKIGTLYAINCLVCYMENTAHWSANTVQLFNLSLELLLSTTPFDKFYPPMWFLKTP